MRSLSSLFVFLTLLFSLGGCAAPEDLLEEEQEDFTFTEEDIARFRELAKEARQQVSGSGASGVPYLEPVLSEEEDDTVHLSLSDAYESLRTMSGDDEENTYRVTNAFLNVRSEARVTASIVERLSQGDPIVVLDFIDAAWAKVRIPQSKKEGYVAQRYIAKLVTDDKISVEKQKFDNLYFVDFGFVNVRKSPDVQSEKLGELPGQAFVHPISMDAVWARVPFEGKEGYIARQYLSPFVPNLLVRQDSYALPIFQYEMDTEGALDMLLSHVGTLRSGSAHFLTFRDFYDTLLKQEKQDVRIPPKSVVLVLSGITPKNIRTVSDALSRVGVRATFFLRTADIGLSGITEKTILTLLSNGFDVQSAGHSGDDLRALTNSQLDMEFAQSKSNIENVIHRPVFAVLYPQGGVNERVMQRAAATGYLFGIVPVPDRTFNRAQFLRLPSFVVGQSMGGEDLLKIVRGER